MNSKKETRYLTQGVDYYKATMSQLEYFKYPDAQVTFRLHNRGENKLSEYVDSDKLSERLNFLSSGLQPEEIAYLASLQNQDGLAQFDEEYLDYIADTELPRVDVSHDQDGELAVSTTGDWPAVTFWETVVMSEINEQYFANKLESEGLSLDDVYTEGDKRLSEKIARLKARPDIKFADFGTRRRFSYQWQKHVVERIATELPDNFVGTSNIYLAYELGLKPIGTYAHEMPMVYCALEDNAGNNPLDGHNKVLEDWNEIYRGDLSTALTDTFTTDHFFDDLTDKQTRSWKALRHDSGDPFEFGKRAIEFYKSNDIDPTTKTICFSDGLDIDMIIKLSDYFKGKIDINFGWGTTLTNDLGLKPNNFVMKAVEVDGTSTVKLSDDEGKHTGHTETVTRYQNLVSDQLSAKAMRRVVIA